MHINRISSARKIILRLCAALVLALLSGCETVTLTDLTPKSMAENPSHIYTFSLRVTPRTSTVTNITPQIVVDGNSYHMKKSALGEGIYDFEYQLPPNRDQMKYYFLVNYSVEGSGAQNQQEAYTPVQTVNIVSRYVLSLEVNRGPVGARISVLGRGFTPQDVVHLDGTPARTVYESPNSLSFFVPPLEPGRNYQVTVNGAAGNSPVGTFRIDATTVSVSPTSLSLRTGESQTLTFTLPNAAPPGGTLLDIATDIPESVIMPEVIVPQGQTSVTVNVEGGAPGSGNLYLKGFGQGELTIPVSVTGR